MRIVPLPQGFGAEVLGFDAQAGRAEADIASLREAYDLHHLLVLRGCGLLAPERHVEIMGWFGPLGANGDGQGKDWTELDNQHPTGSARLPFHCDITYMEHPIAGISLHPRALPRVETSTTFASNALGWEALSPRLQDLLRDRKARHFYGDARLMQMDWPPFEYWNPARLSHAATGRDLLFVTEHHTDRVEGLDEVEGAAVLAEAFAALYAPERLYEHVWREGDLVIWDNLAVQHARTKEARPEDGPRVLQRVAIGEHSFGEQLSALQAKAVA